MKPFLLWVAFLAVITLGVVLALHSQVVQAGKFRQHGQATLNDLTLTPGATIPGVTAKQLCDPDFHTGTVRNVTEEEKLEVCAEYEIDKPHCNGTYEIDHLISLELGGSNDKKNLWPQHYAEPLGAHDKDKLENALHRMVCADTVSLLEAQTCISKDWYECGLSLKVFDEHGSLIK